MLDTDAAPGDGALHGSGDPAGLDREAATSTTLLEVSPGIAVLFGEVPDGVELNDLGLISSSDRLQLSKILGSLGNTGTVVGNVAEASAQGLFRVSDATLSLLKSGGQMAVKDGANIGSILKNGKVIAQARFIPASVTAAAAIAAIGPAVAMMALQMQLGEISDLVQTNVALTTQMLKSIRHEQWSELEGLARSIDRAFREASESDAITNTLWEGVAPSSQTIDKHLGLYRRNVTGHIQELEKSGDWIARRRYLQMNAEAIIFDTHALLRASKTHAEYQAIRAALVRKRSATDEDEAKLFETITRDVPDEIEKELIQIAQLIKSLIRELRLIAELPGKKTMPLTKKRKDAKASKLTCAQLLEAIEPLANMLAPPAEEPPAPDTVCAPEGLDLDPYLRILRWLLEDGEILQAVAFPCEVGTSKDTPALLAKLVDASWKALAHPWVAAIVDPVIPSTFVAVTDRRIITANPTKLLKQGELGPVYSRDEVQHVHPRAAQEMKARAAIDVITTGPNIQWVFPGAANPEHVDALAALLSERSAVEIRAPKAVED